MKLRCNAKINLSLGIMGKREDGYHLIDSVMQSVSVSDKLTVNKGEEISVLCSDGELCGEGNIAYKAAVNFFEYTGIKGGAEILINKGIPQAAGMGGGSADAAGVIVALNEIYSASLSEKELCDIGLKVGADVPFCIIGGTARVKGIGEETEILPSVSGGYFVIAKNGIKSSTGDMYKRFDNLENPYIPDTDGLIEAINKGNLTDIANKTGNSFECLTGLYEIDEILKNTNSLTVSLSGSGPSVFAVYADLKEAEKAFLLLKEKNIEAYIATPESKGVVIEEK